jgi:hydroxyacyl-ACP dehydratase HTD2-like protein with hotdog domain
MKDYNKHYISKEDLIKAQRKQIENESIDRLIQKSKYTHNAFKIQPDDIFIFNKSKIEKSN